MVAYHVNKHNVKKLFMTLVEDGKEDSLVGVGGVGGWWCVGGDVWTTVGFHSQGGTSGSTWVQQGQVGIYSQGARWRVRSMHGKLLEANPEVRWILARLTQQGPCWRQTSLRDEVFDQILRVVRYKSVGGFCSTDLVRFLLKLYRDGEGSQRPGLDEQRRHSSLVKRKHLCQQFIFHGPFKGCWGWV